MEIIEEWPCSKIRYVYAIYDSATGNVLYVGCAREIRRRICTHTKNFKSLVVGEVKARIIGAYEWWDAMVQEKTQIRKHKAEGHPIMNKKDVTDKWRPKKSNVTFKRRIGT